MANPRQLARQRAVQALYSWQMTHGDPVSIDAEFRIENDMDGVDLDYFRELLREIPAQCDALDDIIVPLLPRPLAEVDPVERAILRLGAYELKFRLDVPYRVAINEGVELAKLFGAEQGHRFVNGILDGMARELRGVEQAADERPLPEPAATADVTVGKGKYGQKRAPIIRTAVKKRATRKRVFDKPDAAESDAKAAAKSFTKPAASQRRKPAAAAEKPAAKSLYGAKKTAPATSSAKSSPSAAAKPPVKKSPAKKSGASLYAGKKPGHS